MAITTPHRRRSALSRSLVAVAVWLAVLSGSLVLMPADVAGSPSGAEAPWRWPLAPVPRVEQPFERPATAYGRGHRGIDLSAEEGQPVLAVADGVVTHSGMVAGRGTVTVRHSGGVASTYEPLDDRIAEGTEVGAGVTLGRIGSGSHCEEPCLHLGARLGDEYLDPLLLLTRVRIVLLPLLPGTARTP